MNEIYLDLFISRLQRMYRIEQLKVLIDTTLDQKNEQDFLCFTEELNELLEVTVS